MASQFAIYLMDVFKILGWYINKGNFFNLYKNSNSPSTFFSSLYPISLINESEKRFSTLYYATILTVLNGASTVDYLLAIFVIPPIF